MHPSTVKVAAALRALGVTGQVTELPEPAPTVFPTSFAELVRTTNGTAAGIGVDGN